MMRVNSNSSSLSDPETCDGSRDKLGVDGHVAFMSSPYMLDSWNMKMDNSFISVVVLFKTKRVQAVCRVIFCSVLLFFRVRINTHVYICSTIFSASTASIRLVP